MKCNLLILGLGVLVGLLAPPSMNAQNPGARRGGAVSINAAAWAVADVHTGVILASSNAERRVQIGSITKIATAIVAMDWATAKGVDLSQLATVPSTVTALASPNSIGLQPGDQITLREALYASLMQSDNQAAETLAVHVGRELGGGPSDQAAATFFTAQLNALARKLAMRETRFLNAHGLDDLESKVPYSTSVDVARLANYALNLPGFTFYTSQKERRITWRTAAPEPVSFVLRNTNELLGIDNIDGVKTGNTRKAGPCVVISAAQRPDSKLVGEQHVITPRRLTVVILGSPNRFDVARELLARGWGMHEQWTAAGRPTKGWKAGISAQ